MALAVNVTLGAELLATRYCLDSGVSPSQRPTPGAVPALRPLMAARISAACADLEASTTGERKSRLVSVYTPSEAPFMSLVPHEARHGPGF